MRCSRQAAMEESCFQSECDSGRDVGGPVERVVERARLKRITVKRIEHQEGYQLLLSKLEVLAKVIGSRQGLRREGARRGARRGRR